MTNSNSSPPDRAWLDVDLAALVRNARRFQELIGTPLLPVVKADAYGLGAVPVVRALETVDPWGYGVVTIQEGMALRSAGVSRPILVLQPMLPAGTVATRDLKLTPVIGDFDALDAWLSGGGEPFHIEIDTGMSRHGFRWQDTDTISALARRLEGAGGWEGIFTHFHSADSDPAATRAQVERFDGIVSAMPRRPALVHLSASAGAQGGDNFGAGLVRPGMFLYGGQTGSLVPEPVAALRARVIATRRLGPGDTVSYNPGAVLEKETTIATLAAGYADGVPRGLAGTGQMELHGRRMRVIGRITMDAVMVDAGDTPVAPGDVGTIFGGLVSLEEQAALASSISYVLLTSISPRVERRYRNPT